MRPPVTASKETSSKAVFLDRDGTIIVDGNYISEPAQVELLPGAKEALQQLLAAGFQLFLFTNQSGIGRGFFPIEAAHRCNNRMVELLNLGNPLFTDVCIAPESPDQPAVYRKPNPRFINESIIKYALDRDKCWMVGDKPIDVESGLNAGIKGAMVGARKLPTELKAPVYDSLLNFAQAVTGQAR